MIGQTWKNVRRDGKRDRRFKNNYQIPIVKYGIVMFSASSFEFNFIVSNFKIASDFVKLFNQTFNPPSNKVAFPPRRGRLDPP